MLSYDDRGAGIFQDIALSSPSASNDNKDTNSTTTQSHYTDDEEGRHGLFENEEEYYASQPGDIVSGRSLLQQKRKKMYLGISLVLIGLIMISIGVGVGNSKNKSSSNSKDQDEYSVLDNPIFSTGSPTAFQVQATGVPTMAPTQLDLEEYITGRLHTVQPFQDEHSPASKALKWVEADPRLPNYDKVQISQRFALASLWYGTHHNNWNTTDHWMTEHNECQWYGVGCNEQGFLIKLSLSGNGLKGTIPSELLLLKETLLELDLSHNNLSNTEEELSFLREFGLLRILNFKHTRLQSTNGVPSLFGELTGLHVLNVARTGVYHLKYPIFCVSASCMDITNLLTHSILPYAPLSYLFSEFTGPLDGETFKTLRKLEYLELSNNAFNSTLPVQIPRLPKLEALYLEDTGLTTRNLDWMLHMTNIYEFWADHNPELKGTLPSDIGDLQFLASLSLTDCGITGSLPTEMGVLQELRQVWLSGNLLTGNVPTEIGNLQNLTIFQLEDNDMSGKVPNEVCALRDADIMIAFGTDCDESVNCHCCTCCAAPCEIVRLPDDEGVRRERRSLMATTEDYRAWS